MNAPLNPIPASVPQGVQLPGISLMQIQAMLLARWKLIVAFGFGCALLAAVLSKLFADRQLSPSPDTVPYLARRIERSFAAAHAAVAALDARALDERRAITRALAAEVLDNGAR